MHQPDRAIKNQRSSRLRYCEPAPEDYETAPEKFIDACPNLISIMDEDQAIAYMGHTFSPAIRVLYLELKGGPSWLFTPTPIRAPGLTKLFISAPADTIMSSDGNSEADHYPDKVQALCREITHLEALHLNLPGLCAPVGYKGEHRLPQALFMRGMLPKTLSSITVLELVLPEFCTVEKGSKHESYWVSLHRGWSTSNMAYRDVLSPFT